MVMLFVLAPDIFLLLVYLVGFLHTEIYVLLYPVHHIQRIQHWQRETRLVLDEWLGSYGNGQVRLT